MQRKQYIGFEWELLKLETLNIIVTSTSQKFITSIFNVFLITFRNFLLVFISFHPPLFCMPQSSKHERALSLSFFLFLMGRKRKWRKEMWKAKNPLNNTHSVEHSRTKKGEKKCVSILSYHTIFLLELQDRYRPAISSFSKAETYESVFGTIKSPGNLHFSKPLSLRGVCLNLIHNLLLFL